MGIAVIDPAENTRVPFLRGILTRSLQDVGLPFKKAYEIANEIRKNLSPDAEITTNGLADQVIVLLGEKQFLDALERYKKSPQTRIPIQIIERDGQPQPFSKGLLSQSLEICAFPADERYTIAAGIEQQLLNNDTTELTSTALAELTYQYLQDNEPPEMVQRYLVWTEYARSGRPLILLLGGTTGVGKSTTSSEIAHRLNIVRTQSTDMLREVMRLMIPERLLPSLHVSSFNAWQTLPSRDEKAATFATHFVEGYLTQAREVAVGIEGVTQRAEREQISLILEGVHVHPALQKHLMHETNAIVIPLILAVLKRKQLRRQLKGRGQQVASRQSERYMEHFDAIWELQSFLLEEADRLQIPIIPNVAQEETIRLVMETISDYLAREYTGTPETVFA